MDQAHRETDDLLQALEHHLSDIYSRAYGEVGKSWKDYLKKSSAAIEQYQKAYDSAKKSGDKDEIRRTGIQLQRAKMSRTIMDKRFTDLSNQLAQEISAVNQTAVAYINGELPEVYAMNFNALDSQVSGYSFTLTDAQTVKNLSEKYQNLLPYKKVNGVLDVRWNVGIINSEVLQGIIQGDSMDKIAGRLRNVLQMDANSAIRNARTAVTGAECKGRQDSYEKAEDCGLQVKKMWRATLDGRTRHAHQMLDGKRAAVREAFQSELGEIMYPGDPHAEPANVYNCRCTTIADFGQKMSDTRMARDASGKSVLIKNMTYSEWMEWRQNGGIY